MSFTALSVLAMPSTTFACDLDGWGRAHRYNPFGQSQASGGGFGSELDVPAWKNQPQTAPSPAQNGPSRDDSTSIAEQSAATASVSEERANVEADREETGNSSDPTTAEDKAAFS